MIAAEHVRVFGEGVSFYSWAEETQEPRVVFLASTHNLLIYVAKSRCPKAGHIYLDGIHKIASSTSKMHFTSLTSHGNIKRPFRTNGTNTANTMG